MLCVDHGPGSWEACPHACSRRLCSFVCDAWLTEGAGDRLMRGDVLPAAPGPTTAAAAPPPLTACGKPVQAAGSAKCGTHKAHILPF